MKDFIHFSSIIIMLLSLSLPIDTANAQNIKLEAEDATLNGTSVATARAGFSGTGYVTGFDNADDKIAFTLNVESEGSYTVNLSVASPFGNKKCGLSVNGGVTNMISLNPSEGFTGFFEVDAGQYSLNVGDNSITIHNGWGFFEVDYIELISSIPTSISDVNTNDGILVYPNPISAGLLNVETELTNKTASGEILIYDSKGSQVYAGWINQAKETIDMQNLKTGLYIVKIYSGKITRTFKLVKN